MEDLASLRQESSHIGPGVHRSRQHVRMLMERLGLSNEPTENPGEGDGLLHGTPRRGRGQSLEVKWKIMLDGCGRLHRLDLQRRTDIGERAGSEREGFRMMLLPALILGT